MKNIIAVFLKQLSETLKNKTTLIQFVMLPLIAVIMENLVNLQDMPEHFFALMFAPMFIGMAPLTCMSSIISEEKEQNTLRVLVMSNVRPFQYLTGTGLYVFIMCLVGIGVFGVLSGCKGVDLLIFIGILCAGSLISIIVGAVIGIACRDQMSAVSVTVPVMCVFSFLPMIAQFNESVKTVAGFTYSGQISFLLRTNGVWDADVFSVIVLAVNFAAAAVLFIAVYRKKGMC